MYSNQIIGGGGGGGAQYAIGRNAIGNNGYSNLVIGGGGGAGGNNNANGAGGAGGYASNNAHTSRLYSCPLCKEITSNIIEHAKKRQDVEHTVLVIHDL